MCFDLPLPVAPLWAENENKTQIGDIVVTATKMSTEVDKIPTNITVITQNIGLFFSGPYMALGDVY